MTNNNPQEPFGPGPTGLYRDPQNGKIAGVCAGLAAYFGVKVGGLRVALILLSVFGFFGPVVVAYIVLAVLLHPKPAHLFKDKDDEAFWRSVVRRPAAPPRTGWAPSPAASANWTSAWPGWSAKSLHPTRC